ncbi:MAG TPA: carboxylating nicotinate-nucleotide diphosphorylase [Xanthomonadaceae bacterium]|jgi:nicotinate-nucleotide pyrophosphorylase (carboxylating)|nr:carboxylating nicotinate-nucleotide diphosphorylase [Xanthomonadaceae bacterium]
MPGGTHPSLQPPDPRGVAADVARALAEDIGPGDVTADLLPDVPTQAWVVCKQDAVIAGGPWFDATFRALDGQARIDWNVNEGARVEAGTVLCRLRGNSRALVSGERTALNFLQTLSATATATARFVDAVSGTRARILDTRKTLPGLRLAQKYAVRAGGGCNHRLGLHDAMMLKENHILAAGSLPEAMRRARTMHAGVPLIVEVETLAELDQALAGLPDRILVDEFSMDDLGEAVRRAQGKVPLEVSGGVGLDTVRALAETGVDCISIGALTKHVQAVDLSMRFGTPPGK